MYTYLQGPTVVTRSIRPSRIVVIVSTIEQCELFIQVCSLTWGGKYFCVIPYDSTIGVSDSWKWVVRAYDPDSVVSMCTLDEATEQFFAEMLGKSTHTLDDTGEQGLISNFQHSSRGLGYSLLGALLGQGASERYDYLSPALVPNVASDHPLRPFITARYGDLNEAWGKKIAAQLRFDFPLSLDHLIPMVHLSIADNFVDFICHGERDKHSFLRRQRDSSSPFSLPRQGLPFLDYTLVGLASPDFQSLTPEEIDPIDKARYLLIASDGPAVEDFCWFWNLRAQRATGAEVIWLPANLIEENASHLSELFPSRTFLISKTLSPERLQSLAQSLGRHFTIEQHDLSRFYSQQFSLGIKDRQEVIFDRGRTRIPAPTANEIVYSAYPHHFYVDIDLSEIQLPRLNVNRWGQSQSTLVLYRVSRTGLSFRRYGTEESIKPYLQLTLPTTWQMLETFADIAGYTVQVSDKGTIANQFLQLVGGMNAFWLFSGRTIHMLFNQLSELAQSKEFRGRLKRDIAPVLKRVGDEKLLSRVVEQMMREISSDQHERVHQTLADMKRILKFKRSTVLRNLTKWLLQRHILFRGEEIKCPQCNTKQWLYVDNIQSQIQCRGCQQLIEIPLDVETTHWKYQINALAANAYDAGVIPHLLTLLM